MATFSYTYTYSNGTTADASQVNQNFTDVRNGISDGTSDISVAAITAASTATFNGSINLGNSSTDLITATASLDSGTLPIKSGATYWTFTFPSSGGTANYALTTNGSGTASWTAWSTSSWAATTSALGTVYWPNSHVRSDTGNGHGSSSTCIRRITNSTTTGSGITAANSSTLGNTYTIGQAGVYFVRYTDQYSGGNSYKGVTVNSAQLTTAITSCTVADVMALGYGTGFTTCSGMRILAAADVVRAHTDTGPDSTADDVQFEICQVFRFS